MFNGASTPGLNTPRALAFGAGNLYVSGEGDRVWRFDATTGAFLGSFFGDNPRGLAFGPDNNLYVAQNISNNILRRSGATGAFISEFVPHESGGLTSPFGIRFGPDDNLYVASRGMNAVFRYNGTTGAFIDIFVPSGSGGLSDPHFLAFFTSTAVPEPGTLLLLTSGLVSVGVFGRRSWRKRR